MKPRLSANGRKIAQVRYQTFIANGCSPGQARNAAEVLTLEQENPGYQRTVYDQRAIHYCWQKLTESRNNAKVSAKSSEDVVKLFIKDRAKWPYWDEKKKIKKRHLTHKQAKWLNDLIGREDRNNPNPYIGLLDKTWDLIETEGVFVSFSQRKVNNRNNPYSYILTVSEKST